MNVTISLIVGVLIGWIVTMRNTNAGREILIRNVAAGIAGAFGGSWLLGTLIESNEGGFSLGVIIASLLGAAALLFLVSRLHPT